MSNIISAKSSVIAELAYSRSQHFLSVQRLVTRTKTCESLEPGHSDMDRTFVFVPIAFLTYYLSCYNLFQFILLIQNSSTLFFIGYSSIFGVHRVTRGLITRAQGCRGRIARLQ